MTLKYQAEMQSDPIERPDSHITFHEFESIDLTKCIISVENL